MEEQLSQLNDTLAEFQDAVQRLGISFDESSKTVAELLQETSSEDANCRVSTYPTNKSKERTSVRKYHLGCEENLNYICIASMIHQNWCIASSWNPSSRKVSFNQYRSCWLPGDDRSQRIVSHGIGRGVSRKIFQSHRYKGWILWQLGITAAILDLGIDATSIACETAAKWMPQCPVEDKQTLVQIITVVWLMKPSVVRPSQLHSGIFNSC